MKLKLPLPGNYFKMMRRTLPALAAALAGIAAWTVAVTAQAQSVTLVPGAPLNFWTGNNTPNNSLTNVIVVTETGGGAATNIVLSCSGGSGPVSGTVTPSTLTANGKSALAVTIPSTVSGVYPLTVSASGDATYSTNFNVFVVPQWAQTNAGLTGNWSDATKWSGGAVPLSSDSVYIDHSTPGPWTNVVDTTRSIQDLVYLGNGDDGGAASSALNTTIAPNAILSVLGTNGFIIGRKANTGVRPTYTFYGNSLVVSNPVANFDVTDASANGTRYLTVNMNGLSNLVVTVNRVCIADTSIMGNNPNSADGSQTVNFTLAQTNVIKALYADNYTNNNFNTAIQYDKQDQGANSGQIASGGLMLGVANTFYADSIGVGMGSANGSGTTPFTAFGYQMRFLSVTNPSVTRATFRGTNGGLMSLLAIGIDTGSFSSKNNGVVDLRGGKVDMLVDKIWLGGNKTNLSAAATDMGGFYFDRGTVNANIIEAGFMRYTNVASCAGYVLVGSNATLVANNYIELGRTPNDPTTLANWPNAAASVGQIMITNGGTVLANQIFVGQYGTNNAIIISPGSLLVVSNSIGQSTNALTTLSLNGGNLTFSVTGGVTNAYLTNLNTTTTASKINIASVPAGQSTNVLMVYQSANQTPNLGIGTMPAGFNNMQIVVDTTAKTVSLLVSTNSPKNLVWRGGQNAQWDHSSLNWLDLNAQTTTKFTDGDSVAFDDATGVPTGITVTESVNPSQSGTGIAMTNNLNSFVFTNDSNGGVIGSCSLVKTGTQSVELDGTTMAAVQLNNGILVLGSGGAIAQVVSVSGSSITNLGMITGGVSCAGTVQNSGTINGSLNVLTSGNVVNSGTVNGALSLQSSSSLYNLGALTAIGSATVATNSTLINGGVIYGNSLTVAVGGTLTDITAGSPGVNAGSINVGTLSIAGTFNPGGTGNTIATTVVTDYNYAGNQLGAPNGRIQLSAGSVTTFKVNLTNSQINTELLSQSTVLGPSETYKSVNGGTLVITNVGPTPFAIGQTFQLFGQYYTGGNPGNAGLNTTNAYPVIVPQSPGAGLAWDLSQIYVSGKIGIVDASTLQFSVASSSSIVNGTNVVMSLSWPSDYTGYGWLQQQIVASTNGLGTNWTDIGQSDYVNSIILTNTLISDQAVFYRYILP